MSADAKVIVSNIVPDAQTNGVDHRKVDHSAKSTALSLASELPCSLLSLNELAYVFINRLEEEKNPNISEYLQFSLWVKLDELITERAQSEPIPEPLFPVDLEESDFELSFEE